MARTLVVALVGLLLFGACAAEDNPPDVTIEIANLSFGDPVSVAVGQPLTIRNDDTVGHTWTAVDFSFNSGNLSPGSEFTHTFDAAGEYAYFCEIHPTMTGIVTVAE